MKPQAAPDFKAFDSVQIAHATRSLKQIVVSQGNTVLDSPAPGMEFGSAERLGDRQSIRGTAFETQFKSYD